LGGKKRISGVKRVEALRHTKRYGTDYGAEACPQYVALSVESPAGVLAKVMPPVRTDQDNKAVWRGIDEDLISSAGSDHIAYTLDEQAPGPIWTTRPAFDRAPLIGPPVVRLDPRCPSIDERTPPA
jgi:dihydropyrimidinase